MTSVAIAATSCAVAFVSKAQSRIDMIFLLLFVSLKWRDVNRAKAGATGQRERPALSPRQRGEAAQPSGGSEQPWTLDVTG